MQVTGADHQLGSRQRLHKNTLCVSASQNQEMHQLSWDSCSHLCPHLTSCPLGAQAIAMTLFKD
jgi:hypothetical protein